MKKFLDFIFSMQFALTLLMIFAIAIATATFIENDFGTIAAKKIVYSATWFEILLAIVSISMIGNIFRYKLIQRKKIMVILFHLAFVIILIGAAISRFIGYEGTMSIREGERSNEIVSDGTYVKTTVVNGEETYYFDNATIFSTTGKNRFNKTYRFGEKTCNVSLKYFIPNAAETLIEDPNGIPMISMMISDASGRGTKFLKEGESIRVGQAKICFNLGIKDDQAIFVTFENNLLEFRSSLPLTVMSMATSSVDTLHPGQSYPLESMKLYSFGDASFVVRSFIEKAGTKLVSAPASSDHELSNAIVMDLEHDGTHEELVLFGTRGVIGKQAEATINGVDFSVSYGSKIINIPFSIELRDFQLDRYAGSMSPSSFASEVTLIDKRNNIHEPRRIFMNNVLNYGGYRFFQSSYDPDEKGTILSVNHDQAGTVVTYIGYFFMTLAMVLNFFSKKSRFLWLIRESSRIREKSKNMIGFIIALIILGSTIPAIAQSPHQHTEPKVIVKEHAKDFGKLLVQDQNGRLKPMNTLTSEILRKVSRKNEFLGQSADQVVLGMFAFPQYWQTVPMIKITSPKLKDLLGINGKYASFMDFLDVERDGAYKIGGYVDAAYNKKPAEKGTFDKDIIKVDERVNICYMVYTGSLFKIFPKPQDENRKWYSSNEAVNVFDTTELDFVENILPFYFSSINNGITTGNWTEATENLSYIKLFQERYGKDIFPDENKINIEVLYNKVNIFKRLFPFYSLVGTILLILILVATINPKFSFSVVVKILSGLLWLGFIIHTLGLAARWYIAGHAPWSNGYETMIYIAWAILLSGLIFSRRSKITFAISAILASLTLMVANMTWMDPEITNLVPVLKSYWLVIHVAVITASYSFLAIGALLGFFTMLLVNFVNNNNKERLRLTIEELTNINEINLTIGVTLITIGTFLGAVWANESWGRYWGWDPKETWALVTVLIYSFVIHMRMMPGFRGNFAFNFAALISFGSVLMTYFGVNYYLSGLHSYADGDPVPIPRFVYYAIAMIIIVSIMGYINNRKLERLK